MRTVMPRRWTSARGADEPSKATGLDWLRLHDLRRAFATFLLDQGEELRTVMELLGRSTIRLTAGACGHVLSARARAAADAIDRLLGAPLGGAARGRREGPWR
jgi:site-specific recombinase XerD